MKSALFKDIIREIKRTKSRFFSIFAIIALGAGFFSGLKAACPDMLATYGFDEGDRTPSAPLVAFAGFIRPTRRMFLLITTATQTLLRK